MGDDVRDLEDEKNPVGIIFPGRTRVRITGQSGGGYCVHPSIEGEFVPLDLDVPTHDGRGGRHLCGWMPEPDDELEKPNPWDGYDGAVEQFMALGFGAATRALFDDVPRARRAELHIDGYGEGWLPVLVKPSDHPQLAEHAGRVGILVWPDCD